MRTSLRIFFCFTLFILSECCYSQSITFADSINGLANITMTNLVATNDSSLLIAGVEGLTNWDDNFYVQKINRAGNRVWSKTYDAGYEDKIINMTSTRDKGFIVVANIYNGKKYDLNTLRVLVMKCDSIGNIEWKNEFISRSTKSLSGALIIQPTDGGYCLACLSALDYNSTTKELCLTKLDSNGNIIWSRFHAFDYPVWEITGLAEGPQSAFILSIMGGDCFPYCEKSFIYKFDKTGNFKWGFENYFKKNIEFLDLVQTVGIVSDNKGIHLLSKVFDDGRDFYCYELLDDAGGKSKAIWLDYNIFSLKNFLQKNKIRAFENYSLPQQNMIYKDLIRSDQTVVSGYFSFAFTYGYVRINSYDNKNRICPTYKPKFFSDSTTLNEDSLPKILVQPATDSLIKLSANISLISSQDVFFQLCQSPEYSITAQPNNSTVAKIAQTNSLKVFPNPASNILHVEVNKNAELRLYNSLGMQVRDVNVSHVAPINISDIEPGLYFLKNLNTGKVVKIIIR